MLDKIQITFDVSGICDQDIRITDENYTPETILSGLQDGSLKTVVTSRLEVFRTSDDKCVAVVADLSIKLNFSNFRFI